MIDLHAHTTASDGTFSPRELISHAAALGLKAVAVTDHDTFGGWPEAMQAGAELGIEVVPGIELSVQTVSVSGEGEKFHLLAYYFEPDSELGRELAELQRERAQRNERIIAKLNQMGHKITMERTREIAGPDAQIGRPHIAQALIELGAVSSIQNAFDTLLKDGGPAYSSRKSLHPADAVRLIHDAGGVAVWAHPTRAPSERAALLDFESGETLLRQWVEWGLDGLETHYGAYTVPEIEWTRAMAQKYDLLGTGGSDFHGMNKPTVKLGEVNGQGRVPAEVLDLLKARAQYWRGDRNFSFASLKL